MRLNQLEYLIAISRFGSLSTAANESHISVQTLSASVKALEAELNVTILNRTSHGVYFTDAGKMVLEYALTFVDNFYKLEENLKMLNGNNKKNVFRGPLDIYAAPALQESLLVSKLHDFKRSFPDVDIKIHSMCSREIFNLFDNTDVNGFGLVVLPYNDKHIKSFQTNPKIGFKLISNEQYVCCVSEASPLAHYSSISLKEMIKYPIVSLSNAYTDLNHLTLFELLDMYGIEKINVVSHVTSLPMVAETIRSNIGIAFINTAHTRHDSSVQSYFEGLKFIPIQEPMNIIIGLVYSFNCNFSIDSFWKIFSELPAE